MKLNITTLKISVFILLAATFEGSAQQKALAEAKLVVDSFSPKKDSIISIGVLINLKDDWHIYWRNPGDSGLPTEVEYSLPKDFIVSEIKFPTPKIFYSDEIVNYGYSHQVLFISEISVPKDFNQKEISISARLSSLICKDLCKAFDTTLTITLELIKDSLPPKQISDLFDYTRNFLPTIDQNIKVTAIQNSNSVSLLIEKNVLSETEIKSFEFYPYKAGVFKNVAKQSNYTLGKYLELVLEPDPFRIEEPKEVNGIILLNDDNTKAYEINILIKD